MRPTATLPVLASRTSTSPSFVLLTPPAAPGSHVRSRAVSVWCAHSGAPIFSLVRVRAPELRFSVWTSTCSQAPGFSPVPVSGLELRFSVWSRAHSQAHALSLFSGGYQSASLVRSPVQVANASRRPNAAAPSLFHLSSDICARIHSSPLRTSIRSTGDVRL